MRAGRLDRLITIQRKTTTQDDFGQETESWTTIAARRRASYAPVRGEERFTADQLVAKQQVEFRIRYSSALSGLGPLDRIIYPALADESPEPTPDEDAIFDIVEVAELGRRETLKIIAARRADVS